MRISFFSLALVFLLLSIHHIGWSQTKGVSKEKYDDFYRRQTQLKKEAEKREQGRKGYAEARKKAEADFTKRELDYSRKKQTEDQEKIDKIAEEWMEKQNRQHEEKLNQAREEYITKRKKNYQYKIPESEEFEIE